MPFSGKGYSLKDDNGKKNNAQMNNVQREIEKEDHELAIALQASARSEFDTVKNKGKKKKKNKKSKKSKKKGRKSKCTIL